MLPKTSNLFLLVSMASRTILSDRRVVMKSIECIKTIITKLDLSQGGFDGVETVLSQFSPNDVINDPKAVLDAFIVYLHCVHAIDFYSETWSVMERGGCNLTLRPEQQAVVTSSVGREQEVAAYLQKLQYRTDLLMQVQIQV